MKISFVVPVFNEENAIPVFYAALKDFEHLKNHNLEIVFINDGSQDRTETILSEISSIDDSVIVLNFSRKFGKEAALFAGLDHCTGDAVIPMDVDLQDPLYIIPAMIEKWKSGSEVVLAQREDRNTDSFFKKNSAKLFYKFYNLIANLDIPQNVGDFRLMDRAVVDSIKDMPERKLFMKGIFNWVGYTQDIVLYKRDERVVGHSKFNGWQLFKFAFDGIFSFSTIPLRVWTILGCFISLLSFMFALYMVFEKVKFGNPILGYPSVMCAVLFLGGVQLISIGVIGEYIGRIYHEVKCRPRYILKNITIKGEKVNSIPKSHGV